MSMVAGFPWVDKTGRRSCHRRNEYDVSTELGVFGAERYYSTTTIESLPQNLALPTKEVHHGRSSTRFWRELGRASLDIAPHRQSKEVFFDTLNQTKDNDTHNKKKKQKPSSPGAKLASFFNSLITQAVSSSKKTKKKKMKPSKLVEEEKEESLSGWRRRRSSISHFSSSTPASTATSTRPKRTSMSDIYAGFRTPPAPTNKHNNNICIAKKNANLKGRNLVQESKEFKRFVVEDDGAESDSSSDLFELNLSYQNRSHRLGYCGGDLPVYETTHMDGIKISPAASVTNCPFKDS